MAVLLRTARDEDFEEILVNDERSFGFTTNDDERELLRRLLDLDRFRVATDSGRIVGAAGSFTMELTVPGPSCIPVGGITWVSVVPTHRRRGVLRRLMESIHDDIDRRGEVAGALIASEGGIYERFGYGVAAYRRSVEIDRRHTQIRPEFTPDLSDVRFVRPADHVEHFHELFERYRRTRVGEMNRSETLVALEVHDGGSELRAAVHPDGYVMWKMTTDWSATLPAHRIEIVDLVAITDDAHVALWHLVLSIDLAGPISSYRAAAVDDPLPYLLTNPRALATRSLYDRLWLSPRRIGDFLNARTYATEDTFVVEVDVGTERPERWRIAGSPDGAEAERVRSRPDLVLDRASLGSLGLGGVRASELARGRRLTVRSEATLRRADHFFSTSPLPHVTTNF